jgi:hypothetical protein
MAPLVSAHWSTAYHVGFHRAPAWLLILSPGSMKTAAMTHERPAGVQPTLLRSEDCSRYDCLRMALQHVHY